MSAYRLTAFDGPRPLTMFESSGLLLENDLRSLYKNKSPLICPHQIEAVFAVKAKLTETMMKKPVLVVAPTGSGKSGIIAMLPYVLQSRKVLVLSPSLVISTQLGRSFGLFEDYDSFFEEVKICESREARRNFMEKGVIIETTGEIVTNSHLNLVIVNAQKFSGTSKIALTTLEYRGAKVVEKVHEFFAQFDTLIVDEAHHYPAATWKNIEQAFRKSAGEKKQTIFLTATPKRIFNREEIDILENQQVAYEIKRDKLEGKAR